MDAPTIYAQAKRLEVVIDEIHEAIVDRHGVSDDLAVKTLTASARCFGIVCDAERQEMVEDVKGL